ncbi:uncharacterized protein LOC143459324 [Clavelina lepadiformis]|uniref:uncharacterized protein LOC143459324 n=1 Tax=Clavelina lepadiformis TaxID=159417 RepID=UPI004041B0B2
MESSFFDTSSTLEYDLELEELIQCVEIGKNAVDKVSGKCYFTSNHSSSLKEVQSASRDHFDSLTMTTNSKYLEKDDDCNNPKRSRLTHCSFPFSEDLCQIKGDLDNKGRPETSTEHCEMSLVARKRKRLLLDEEALFMAEDPSCQELSLEASCEQDERLQQNSAKENDRELTCNIQSEKESRMIDDEDGLSNSSSTSFQDENALSLRSATSEDGRDGDSLPNLEDLTLQEQSPLNDLAAMNTRQALKRKIIEDGKKPENSTQQENIMDQSISEVTMESTNEENSSKMNQSTHNLRKRIRKTLPPVKTRQTPLGLPKPLRIKKDNFSIEEIYTNKNYSTPVPKLLETIFEYPKEEKDGTTRFAEKRKKQRAMYFVTNPAERPAKKRKRKKFKRRSTRQNRIDKDVETDTKLLSVLTELDEHMKLNGLSP